MKAPMPPVREPTAVLIPRRIWGRKVTLMTRERGGEVDFNGRVWNVVSSLFLNYKPIEVYYAE